MLSTIVFFFILILAILLEGIGIPYDRKIPLYLIIALPFFVLILNLKNNKFLAPKNFTILSSSFILLSIPSFILSANMDQSFRFLLLYFSYFLIFIFTFNNKEGLEKFLVPVIFFLSIVFSLYFLAPLFIPETGYQFVFPKFLSHNHLADFLLLPLVACFYYLLSKRTKIYNLQSIIYNLLILFFVPYFIFSYSRSAYLDIVIVAAAVFFNRILEKRKLPKIIPTFAIILTILVSSVLFLSTTKDIKKEGIVAGAERFLSIKYGFEGKEFLASRDQYIGESSLSIFSNPLFGIGPGNFYYASVKFTKAPSLWTETAHNIFLDVFVENGILAGIVFVFIIIGIFKRSEKNIFFFLLLALFLNFLTDYTYRIYSFLALFFVLAGIIYKEKTLIEIKKPLAIVSVLLLVAASAIFLSSLASKASNHILAFYLYPLNKASYQPLIESSILRKDKEEETFLLLLYRNLFRGDSEVLNYLGRTYERKENEALALKYYEEAFEADSFRDWGIIRKIYDLKRSIEGERKAQEFTERVFQKVEQVKDKWTINEDFRIETMKLCQKLYSLHCPYNL